MSVLGAVGVLLRRDRRAPSLPRHQVPPPSRPQGPSRRQAHNDALEITWTVIPTIICVFLFYYGWHVLRSRRHTADEGRRDQRARVAVELAVHPLERRAGLRSSCPGQHAGPPGDDIEGCAPQLLRAGHAREAGHHPAALHLRVVLPDQAGHLPADLRGVLRHRPLADGAHQPDAAECARWPRRVVVVHEPGGYERYLRRQGRADRAPDLEEPRRDSCYEKKGCVGCHTIDGSARIGPTLEGARTGAPTSRCTTAARSRWTRTTSANRSSCRSAAGRTRASPTTMPVVRASSKTTEIEGPIAFIKSLKQP